LQFLITLKAGMDNLRKKSILLTSYLEYLLTSKFGENIKNELASGIGKILLFSGSFSIGGSSFSSICLKINSKNNDYFFTNLNINYFSSIISLPDSAACSASNSFASIYKLKIILSNINNI
jgi:hypothetical protein